MRAILVFTILLLGLTGAAPEPEYSLFSTSVRAERDLLDGLVEIESSIHRSDRLSLASLGPRVLRVEILRPETRDAPLRLASLNSDLDLDGANTQDGAPTASPQPTTLDNLCNTLFTSAQDNDLPVPFFANLLWQESRLRVDDISKKGAQGIAQFMPKTAVETGLANPFDPMQAIPASARFLQRLRLQFGNLGFVAAAYNAGAHRVIEWLERRASLPRETRDYVLRVTGLSVEAWRSMPIDSAALTFVPHLPCRSLPAFANVEQEQLQQTELERAKRTPTEDEVASNLDAADQAAMPAAPENTRQSKHERVREARHPARESQSTKHASKREAKHEASHIAQEERRSKHEPTHIAREGQSSTHGSKHEAAHTTRGAREKHRSA
jgi:transglycosylase-like protein with SLT domain